MQKLLRSKSARTAVLAFLLAWGAGFAMQNPSAFASDDASHGIATVTLPADPALPALNVALSAPRWRYRPAELPDIWTAYR